MSTAAAAARPRSDLGDRLAAGLLRAAAAIALALPDPALHRLAALAGAGWYLVAPRRRSRARANLRRVCVSLVVSGRASPRVAAAARDPRALERLVRSAFQHGARYYLEVLLSPKFDGAYFAERLLIDDAPAVAGWLGGGGPMIVLGLHLGSLEMPAAYFTQVLSLPVTAPMEILKSPRIQAFVDEARSRSGIHIVPIDGSRAKLTGALRRSECIGLISDRDVSGTGVPTTLFGAPANLPAGAALLAVGTGAPAYAAAARRTGWGTYAGRVIPIATPAAGTHRERTMAFLAAQADAFERLIADAPDQWWTVFFPIWPDLDEVRS